MIRFRAAFARFSSIQTSMGPDGKVITTIKSQEELKRETADMQDKGVMKPEDNPFSKQHDNAEFYGLPFEKSQPQNELELSAKLKKSFKAPNNLFDFYEQNQA